MSICDLCSIVPDVEQEIEKAVREAVDFQGCDLVLVSGGTGFTPDDVTPEAVLRVIDKRADSLEHYLQTEALKITPMTSLSRTVIGMVRKGDK